MSAADILKREEAKARRDALVLSLLQQLKALKLTEGMERELRFHPNRMWRFDMAYPRERIAIEVDGGVFTRGRHTQGAGFEGDCEKGNEAALLGWRVLHVTSNHIRKGWAADWIGRALGVRT